MGTSERVARAESRARRLAFAQSCERDVGALLTVLAAGVPAGGRVLEIGTGVGYGTAWLVEGLGDRGDVELVSVEIDAAHHGAVAADPWPPVVHFLLGDVLELFDMRLDRTIDALRPGGLLVVDDMRRPTVETVPDQAHRTERVREALRADARLLVVELDWSSGVMLARRRWQ